MISLKKWSIKVGWYDQQLIFSLLIVIEISLGILKVGGFVLEIFNTKNLSSNFSIIDALNPTPNKIKVLLCPTWMLCIAFLRHRIVCELAVKTLLLTIMFVSFIKNQIDVFLFVNWIIFLFLALKRCKLIAFGIVKDFIFRSRNQNLGNVTLYLNSRMDVY